MPLDKTVLLLEPDLHCCRGISHRVEVGIPGAISAVQLITIVEEADATTVARGRLTNFNSIKPTLTISKMATMYTDNHLKL